MGYVSGSMQVIGRMFDESAVVNVCVMDGAHWHFYRCDSDQTGEGLPYMCPRARNKERKFPETPHGAISRLGS